MDSITDMGSATIEKIEDRIVEVLFEYDGESLAQWLNDLGINAAISDGVIVAINPVSGYRTGFHCNDDPSTKGVCVASVIFTPTHWMVALPGLMGKIKKTWSLPQYRRKSKKKAG